jgi:hypothetical protein
MSRSHQAELPLAAGHAPPGTQTYPWAALSDEELLKWRIAELRLKIKDSDVQPAVEKLHAELENKGVLFRPACYLTTEWLTPDKIPLIGIPFCLAHPRLRQLEKTMMLEVEGGTERGCMRLLRHEAGHAFNYAYRFYRRSRWRELFGSFSAEYNVVDYYPRPYSRQYVVHLEDNYAQAHPDEDFAETFAVWATPGLDWRRKYKGWGALPKLEYVDHLMRTAGRQPPAITTGPKLWPVNRVRSTLENYYKRKRVEFADGYPGYYDPDLKGLFSAEQSADAVAASRLLSRHRKMLTSTVSKWTHVPKYSVDQLIRRLSRRARDLNLYTRTSEAEALTPLSVYLTALMCDKRQRRENVQKED